MMRIFCAVAAISASIGTWELGRRLLDLPPGIWQSDHWSPSTIALFVAALAIGATFGLAGAFVGLAIPVRSERANFILIAIWHYLATGLALWLFLVMLVLQKTGQRPADLVRFSWETTALAAGGSVAIALLLLASLLRFPRPRVLSSIVLAFPIALAMAWLQTRVLGTMAPYLLFLAIAFPIGLVIAAAWFIARDVEARSRFVSGN